MADEAHAERPAAAGTLPAAGDDRISALALKLVAANTRVNALAIVACLALIVLGVWMYSGVKHSLREIRAAGLQAVLDAEVQALDLWIGERNADVAHWAGEPVVRESVEALLLLAANGRPDAAELWNAPARSRLAAALAPALKQTGAMAFNVIEPGGLIVATQVREYAGRRVKAGTFLAQLAPVFAGESRFIRPYLEQERISGLEKPAFDGPVIWFDAPVRNASGEVIAALGLGQYANAKFAHILSAVQFGRSGEVYAFDSAGVMLSESRFLPQLQKLGLVPERAGASAMATLALRDPGGDLAAGHKPDLEAGARPHTRLAALALAARGKPDEAARRGVVLEPYRGYRGTEVVGAWRWLAAYDLGVATEMEAREAYAPLRYVTLAFAVIMSVLTAVLLVAAWSAFVVRRLRREVGDARTLGQYRLEREIGDGGMGKVYLARHALLKRPTAVKVLKSHLATDEVVARFEREVQLASQLVHPNTVAIYDYGRTSEGVFYYVMEYLEGATLDEIVTQHGAMPVGRAIRVLTQACAALREAHARNLVHRDVKPHNIMLCRRGGEYDVVKILDFGIVKDTASAQTRDLTQYQRVLGTPRYMAPERIRSPADADARADIYSVGAVAFFLVTGRELFDGTSEHDLAYQTLHTEPPRLTGLAPGVPARLDALVARCLAKERSERPHDIVAVMTELEALALEFPWTQQQAARASLASGVQPDAAEVPGA